GLAMRWTRSLNIPLDMGPRQPNYGFSLVDAHQIRFVLYSNYEGYGPDQDRRRVSAMSEVLVRFFIEQLPEGAYLVTSDDVPGLVAQGRTVTKRPRRLPKTSYGGWLSLIETTGIPYPLACSACFQGMGKSLRRSRSIKWGCCPACPTDDVTRKLRVAGFEFDRTAKGSHEIWRNALDGRRTGQHC
ncbi:MAG: hypothetical protein ACYCOU_08370, partial [Sulfobacillus sp.]